MGDMEKDIYDLAKHNTKENLDLVIKKPANCKSAKDCSYITENFISLKGINKTAAGLTSLGVSNLTMASGVKVLKGDKENIEKEGKIPKMEMEA
jgi:hypothetical protein